MKKHIFVCFCVFFAFYCAFAEVSNLSKEKSLTLNGVTQTEVTNKDRSTTYIYWLNGTQIATEQFSPEDHLIKKTGIIPDGIVCITDNAGIGKIIPYANRTRNGIKSEIPYENNRRNGVKKGYHENSALKEEIPYKHDKKEGIAKEYYETDYYCASDFYRENGDQKIPPFDEFKVDRAERARFEGGTQEVVEKKYYNSGVLKQTITLFRMSKKIKIETPYKNDKKEGIEKGYYESGKVAVEIPYVSDKIDGVYKSFYENGAVDLVIPYKNDKKDGTGKEYYENGNIKLEVPLKNGIEEGIEKVYYTSGALAQVTTYKNNKKNGPCKKYAEDGRIIFKGTFKDDLEQD